MIGDAVLIVWALALSWLADMFGRYVAREVLLGTAFAGGLFALIFTLASLAAS